MGRPRRLSAIAIGVALVSTAASCSDDEPTGTSVADTASTTTTAVVVDDGVLTIGVLLPITGAGSELGTVMRDAIELAADEVRAADDGRPVELIVVDETELGGTLPPALEEIFGEDVDAIVGPASNLLTERLLPMTVSARVLTCSPTASAISLDAVPDGGLFVRTIPSDSMQARALARQLDATGTEIVLAHVDDPFGVPFVERVRNELNLFGATVVDVVPFDPRQSEYGEVADRIVGSGAATIGVIGDPEAGPRLMQALGAVVDPGVQTSIWMNDAMRVPQSTSYRRLPSGVLALMQGVSPRSSVADPEAAARLPEGGRFFGANAYDCLNLIALAAHEADSTIGTAIAQQVTVVTSGGTPCSTYPTCLTSLDAGRSVDYDGPGGALDIGVSGDPSVGAFELYRFGSSGLDERFGDVVRVP
ncbi:MAG: ABC transporter substrate-binding protein [Acidimicrobiales bacterium]|nr:ABC transporter substrate-binding protein [Acidimicrobiales bacterium]MCB9395806.1 ABC transporter substrate-binding protein [Acidimicrobiaceae bacterium]